MVEKYDTRCVFKVTKGETMRDTHFLMNVCEHKKVDVGLVQGHEDHFVATLDHPLYHLYTLCVDEETLHGLPHILVECIHQETDSSQGYLTSHFSELVLS